MCGIVGFVGSRQAQAVLMDGLEKLSYRGYDSAGIAVVAHNKSITVRKTQGKVERLKQLLCEKPVDGAVGIGHTRWATHGKPNDQNAHPHLDASGQIAVVHNGMIENYHELRCELEKKGVAFVSETDTEVVAHLLKELFTGDMVRTVAKTARMLKGSYALGIVSSADPDRMIFVRCGSPLIAAYRDGEGMIASDVTALLWFARDVVYLEEKQIGVLTRQGIQLYDDNGQCVPFKTSHIDWEQTSAEKGGFAHYMLKEIYEQPTALRNAAIGRGDPYSSQWFPLNAEEIRKLRKITIIGCGTAYHAGILGSYAIEGIARIPTQAEISSEYRYRDPVFQENELIIAVSQSGETADTLAAVREAHGKGARVLAVCNVVGSTLAREAGEKNTLYTCAGPEISVASTKAYVTQTEVLILIAGIMGRERRTIPDKRLIRLFECISHLPDDAVQTLKLEKMIHQIAAEDQNQKYLLFVGRSLDYALCMEAALKLKEISYIFSQAYPAGELKHGPIALLHPGQMVIAVVTQEKTLEKMIGNLQEMHARGARIVAVCMQKLAEKIKPHADQIMEIPYTDEWLAPILAAIPMQMFAYYMAVERGCDVDHPRNLAKSVTVE